MKTFLITLLTLTLTTQTALARPSVRELKGSKDLLIEQRRNYFNNLDPAARNWKWFYSPLHATGFEYPDDWRWGITHLNSTDFGGYRFADEEYIYVIDKEEPEDDASLFVGIRTKKDIVSKEMLNEEMEIYLHKPESVFEQDHMPYLRNLEIISQEQTTFRGFLALESTFTYTAYSLDLQQTELFVAKANKIYKFAYRNTQDQFDREYDVFAHLLTTIEIPGLQERHIESISDNDADVFTDISDAHEFYDAALYLKERNIVRGYEDNTYKPNKSINRAEFIKIMTSPPLVDQEELDACTDVPFPDVPEDSWFFPHVCVAYQRGMIGGYPDETFKPDQTISFVEAAKIVALFFEDNVETDEEVWYRPFVRRLANRNAIPRSIGGVTTALTRGQMAEIIYRLHAHIENKDSVSADELLE